MTHYTEEKTTAYDAKNSDLYDVGFSAGLKGAPRKNPGFTQTEKMFYRNGYNAGKKTANF